MINQWEGPRRDLVFLLPIDVKDSAAGDQRVQSGSAKEEVEHLRSCGHDLLEVIKD